MFERILPMVHLGNLISKNVKNRNKNILDLSHDIASCEKWCQCLDKKSPGFQCCKAKFKYAYI